MKLILALYVLLLTEISFGQNEISFENVRNNKTLSIEKSAILALQLNDKTELDVYDFHYSDSIFQFKTNLRGVLLDTTVSFSSVKGIVYCQKKNIQKCDKHTLDKGFITIPTVILVIGAPITSILIHPASGIILTGTAALYFSTAILIDRPKLVKLKKWKIC